MIKQKGLLTITDISPNNKETEIIVPVMDYTQFSIGDPLPILFQYNTPADKIYNGVNIDGYNAFTRFKIKTTNGDFFCLIGDKKDDKPDINMNSVHPGPVSDWEAKKYYFALSKGTSYNFSNRNIKILSIGFYDYWYHGSAEKYWAANTTLLTVNIFLPGLYDNQVKIPYSTTISYDYYESGYDDKTGFTANCYGMGLNSFNGESGYLVSDALTNITVNGKNFESVLFKPVIMPNEKHPKEKIESAIESDVVSYIRSGEDIGMSFFVINLENLSGYTEKEAEVIVPQDPYNKDPDSQGNNDPGGHKGGDGKYQDTDEDVPIPGLPQISATDTGLCTLYNPSNAELKELSDYLWSDVFSVESFKKLFADPMDIILGMSIVPLKVSDGERAEIKVGGLGTGVSMNKCKTQYIEVDCGSLDISNYWDNFMDYDPYTKYTLYLPYVGYKVLHADELVDKTITVKYHCDILSGACMAYVQCGKKVLYCFEGNISIQIPVTSASYDNMIHGMLQVASGVGQIIAGGASMAAGGAGAGLMVSGAVGTATGATSAIKPTIGRSGNAESSTGLMGIQKPYLIISRPRAVVPSGLNKYSGYPAYKGGKLGDFNNFTVVQDIRIKNLNGATMEEMNEAERLCKEGVIV